MGGSHQMCSTPHNSQMFIVVPQQKNHFNPELYKKKSTFASYKLNRSIHLCTLLPPQLSQKLQKLCQKKRISAMPL